ncbi:MAG TPA: OstA-like protein [Chitinophagaceae bacterium]|nr:OstA-like protein [Chitinophagaceae bacterium]
MKRLILLLFLWQTAVSLLAQQPVIVQSADTARIVTIKHADRLILRRDTANDLFIGAGHVFFQDDKTAFYCDSAVHNKRLNILEAFGNVHINDADSVHAYSQYLIYHSDTKIATLQRGVKLTDGKSVLTSENLDYDTRLKIGTYKNGGKIVREKTVITSRDATYYTDLKDVYFKNDVKLKDPSYDLVTDSLLYNTSTQVATFITNTYIKDSSGTEIITSEGYYDLKNKIARLGKRSIVRDKALTITGDELGKDSSGLFQASGNAIMIDTSQGITVIANDIKAQQRNNTFIATQHPLMILKQDKDSIYVTADTLFSGRMQDTTKRYFQGFHQVRIFSDSLQAVSDSLYYSGADSVFQLFDDPVVWASDSQITGDTIYLYTKNKKPERLYVFENAFAINKTGRDMYNQLKGRIINGYFVDGNIDYMRAKGSAESVYYAIGEDSALASINKATGDIIDLRFLNKELKQVVIIKQAEGTMLPPRQASEQDKLLRNFRWRDDIRPKTKFELFEEVKPQPAQKLDTPDKS